MVFHGVLTVDGGAKFLQGGRDVWRFIDHRTTSDDGIDADQIQGPPVPTTGVTS